MADGADIDERADTEHDHGAFLYALTPLMIAAGSADGADADTLRWLVEHGADIHATSRAGVTAAFYAAGDGRQWMFERPDLDDNEYERLRYLLDVGLDPNESANNGGTLLLEACNAGNAPRVRLLLDRGLDASPPPSANQLRVMGRLKLLRDGDATKESDAPGLAMTTDIPLFCAARSGSAECVRVLVSAGADVNATDCFGSSPLAIAGSRAVAGVLLDYGVDVSAADGLGHDPLHSIVFGDSPSRVRRTPIDERRAIAKMLVRAGADLEKNDKASPSRLYSAVFGVEAEAVDILLELGARVDVRDAEGSTLLHAAGWSTDWDLDNCPDENRETAETHNSEIERIIRSVCDAGVAVDATDDFGQQPLHEAAGGDGGNATAVSLLLDLGATPNATDKDGQTALMFAAQDGNPACTALLLRAGADTELVDRAGHTALEYAKETLAACEAQDRQGPEEVSNVLRDSYMEIVRELGVEDSKNFEPPDYAEQMKRHSRERLVAARRVVALLQNERSGS